MRYVFPLIAISLASCATVQDVRTKGIFYQGQSSKPVDELAACVTDALRSGPGVNVTSTPLKNGVSLVQSINGQFGYTVFMTADVEREENGSHLTVYSISGPAKKAKSTEPFARCVG